MSDTDKFPSQLAERFQVRLPDGMRDRLREAAELNNRSMNAEIVARLDASLNTDKVVGLSGNYDNLHNLKEQIKDLFVVSRINSAIDIFKLLKEHPGLLEEEIPDIEIVLDIVKKKENS